MEYESSGEVWRISKTTLINDDCMNILRQTPDNYYDICICDPPYGIGEDGAKNHSRGKAAKSKEYAAKDWDSETPSQDYFSELFRISENQIIWGANYMIDKISKPSMGWVFWDKHMEAQDFSDGELAYTSFNRALAKFDFAWNGMIQGDMKNKELRIHPTQKPVKLYQWLLDNYAEKGQRILDTHLGSGSSAIAAHYFGCDFVGIELDEDYFNAAKARFEQMTRQEVLF